MAQIKLHDQRKPLELWKLIGRCTVSCISVLLSQLALSLVPRFFSASPLFIQLILSGPLSLSIFIFYIYVYMKLIGFETFGGFLWFCSSGVVSGCGFGEM